MGIGLAPLPCKNYAATETPKVNQQTTEVLGEVLSSRRFMTSCRESRKEPAMLATLLSPRKTLNMFITAVCVLFLIKSPLAYGFWR